MTKKKELSVKVGDRKDGLEGESRASEQASQEAESERCKKE